MSPKRVKRYRFQEAGSVRRNNCVPLYKISVKFYYSGYIITFEYQITLHDNVYTVFK